MQRIDEGAQIRALADGVAQRHLSPEQRARFRCFDLEVRMDDDRGQAVWHRQADDVRRIGGADEDEATVNRRRDVVAMRRAGAAPFAFERAGEQAIERRLRADERVDRDDRGDGAGGAAAESAREREAFADGS